MGMSRGMAARSALRFDRRGHRAFRAGDETIGAEGVDLVPLQLGVLHGGREHDDSALVVDLLGELPAPLRRMPEELAEHDDHVLVGVIVVVPENDVIPRLPTGPVVGGFLLFGGGGGLLDGDGGRRVGLGGGGLG